MQIRAGLKKEWIFFGKSFRLYVILITMIILPLVTPVMMKSIETVMDKTSELTQGLVEDTPSEVPEGSENYEYYNATHVVCPDCGNEITNYEYEQYEVTTALTQANEQMDAAMNMVSNVFGIRLGFVSVLGELSSDCLLVFMLCLMGAAGGEQKKRNVIIPNCSGLTSWGYILPKFIMYPLFTMLASFASGYFGYYVCTLLYSETLPALDVFNFILGNSIYCAFIVVCYFALGLSTGKAGISVLVVYIVKIILPTVLEFADVNEYNPLSLSKYSLGQNWSVDGKELAISIAMTVVLSLFFMFLTYLFVNLRKIDNQRKVEVANVSDN